MQDDASRARLTPTTTHHSLSSYSSSSEPRVQFPTSRRGKAPPIEPFTGEGVDMLFEEWLPSFERAVVGNGWGEAEKLIQLVGHLRGKALQEWSLL